MKKIVMTVVITGLLLALGGGWEVEAVAAEWLSD